MAEVWLAYGSDEPRSVGEPSAIVVDGCYFSPYALTALARSDGELYCCEREGEYVVIHTVGAEIGGGFGRLVVQRAHKRPEPAEVAAEVEETP